MSSQRFVSNASPLIAFERLEQLNLFQQLVTTVYIPSAVRQEVFGAGAMPDWVIEHPISQPVSSIALSPRLGAGEREAIVLALELAPTLLLLDDLAARRSAQAMSLPVIGTVGLLILARDRNLIPALKPHLDRLLKEEFHIADELYQLALRRAGE